MSDVPLPTRVCLVTNVGADKPQQFILATRLGVKLMESPVGTSLDLFNAKQMHAYAAAVSAAENAGFQSTLADSHAYVERLKRRIDEVLAENARLREAIQHYEAALKQALPGGAQGRTLDHWNAARIAVQGSQP